MLDQIQQILKQHQIFFHLNQGITIATVPTLHEGFAVAKEILYNVVDHKTALYLSGGSTPKVLYEAFAKEEKIIPGAVGVVDERFGPKFHEKSNEKMFQATGFLRYLQMRAIPFYPVLTGRHREPEGRGDLKKHDLAIGNAGIASSSTTPRNDEGRKQAAEAYDEKLRTLNATYQTSVAILGVGVDGHTSSMAPNRPDFINPMFEEKHLLVSEFNDSKSFYGERVGMTFLGLSMLDLLIILAFGVDKKKPLELLFTDGPEEEIPARFFKRPDVAKKTLLITDQSI